MIAAARYRLLSPEVVDALPPKEREAYAAERARFDREVAQLVAIAKETGRIDLTPIDVQGKPATREGRPVFMSLPVVLVDRRRR